MFCRSGLFQSGMLEPDAPDVRPTLARPPGARPASTRRVPGGCGCHFHQPSARPPVARRTDCHFVVFSSVCLFVSIIYVSCKPVKNVFIYSLKVIFSVFREFPILEPTNFRSNRSGLDGRRAGAGVKVTARPAHPPDGWCRAPGGFGRNSTIVGHPVGRPINIPATVQ